MRRRPARYTANTAGCISPYQVALVRGNVIEKLHLSADSPIPRFLQLKSQFEYLIVTGELPPGSKLPSIRELSRALGVGSATLVRAYRELEADGLAVSNSGVGYFVLGSDLSNHATHGEVRAQVRDLLHSALRQGVSLDQTVQIFTAQVAALQDSLARPEILVVCKRDGRVDELAMRLRHRLADLHIEVVGLPLEDIAEDLDRWLPRLQRARYVVSLLFDIKQARTLLEPQGIEIIPILATLAEEVRDRLLHLPPDIRLGVVASSLEFIDGMITAISAFNPNVTIVGSADSRDRHRLEQLFTQVDCVVYGTLSRATIAEILPRSVESIEFIYVPDEVSIQRLRSPLTEEGRG